MYRTLLLGRPYLSNKSGCLSVVIGTLTRDDFRAQVKSIRRELKRLLEEGAHPEIETGDQTDQTPFAKTVRICRKWLTVESVFWAFVEHDGVAPTNNVAERAL